MLGKRAPVLGLVTASVILPALAAAAFLGQATSSDASVSAARQAHGEERGEQPGDLAACVEPTPVPLAPLPVAAAVEPELFVDRADLAVEGREARALRAFAKTLHAPGAPLEEPCAEPTTTGAVDDEKRCACARGALEPFWSALDRSRARGRRAGVVVFGNSLIASDGIVEVVRRRLVERFGDGGPGLLLADRMASYGPRSRTANAADGWRPETVAGIPAPPTLPLGLAGVHHVSTGKAMSRFRLPGATPSVTLFWLERPGAPPLEWRVEGGPWAPVATRADAAEPVAASKPKGTKARSTLLVVEAASTRKKRPGFIEVRSRGEGAAVQGVVVEHEAGGVVVDTLGVPSADAALWLEADEEIFARQLAARAPSLVVAMLGGNEVRRLAWGRSSRAEIERDLRALLGRARDATGAACLVVGPIDAVEGASEQEGERAADRPDRFVQRAQLDPVIEIERRVALEEGCGFLDLYAAMGGRGSLKRFHDAGVMHDDLNHPRGRGLDMLGQLVADALLEAYATSVHPPPRSLVAARSP